jgi:hypothetical protein
MPLAAAAQLGGDVVAVLVLGDEGVDLGVGRGVDSSDEVVDAERVDGHTEADLRLDLVTFGDGDVAHVVAETHEPQRAQLGEAAGGARPGCDA